jgi:hypothetical protein
MSNDSNNDSGGAAFPAMLVIILFMVVACMILPLVVPGFARQEWAVPVMGIALLLPFVHFFIFGALLIKRK